MQMAKGVAPHRTVKDRERGNRQEILEPILEPIKLTEFLPGDDDAKPDTVSVLPAVETSSPPPSSRPSPRLPQIEIEAEIVEPVAPTTAPAQAPLEIEVEEPPAAPVRLKTMSPASPSQSAAILVLEIYKLLPKMSEGDLKGASASLTELVGVIESRWMKGGRP
jgi:hypothetical protein